MGEVSFKKIFLGFLFVIGLFLLVVVMKNSGYSIFSKSVDNDASFVQTNFNELNTVKTNDLVTGFVVHPLYPSFSSPVSGFVFSNVSGLVSATDTIVYKVGYYSVNGGAWQSFTLSGTAYNGDVNWLAGSSSRTIPVFGVGEHYVIVYSCTYNSSAGSWDCHDGRWQLIVVNNSAVVVPPSNSLCGGGVCGVGEYCFNDVCLLNVSGHTYFVATTGNDNNPGTFEQPFATWQKGVDVAHAGDIVYIRGGVYMFTEHIAGSAPIGMLIDPVGYGVGRSGTAQAPIRYYNYPGETPILDGSLATPNSNRWNGGIGVDNAEYLYFRGLTIRNIYQTPPDPNHVKVYSEAFGFGANGANFKFENIIVHDIDGRGFTHWSGAWNEVDGPGALFNSDNTSWINCDAYNLYDRYAMEPGNAADGWKVQGYEGNYFYWEGCRAWNYADDGFDPSGSEYRTFKNCWAMSTDKYKDLSPLWAIEGNGFKVTGVNTVSIPDYVYGAENYVRFENCIAADNVGIGFYNNIVVNYQDQLPNGAIFYNNLAYRNGIGYSDADGSIYRNNIAYAAQQTEATGDPYEVYLYETTVDTVANTWISTGMVDADWWWKYNPDYSVSDGDFVSVDATQLTLPRKADGSLPDITFLHLKQGSDLIDGGVVVAGYHCSTVGAHPGENCREWYGSAPDLGPFESNY